MVSKHTVRAGKGHFCAGPHTADPCRGLARVQDVNPAISVLIVDGHQMFRQGIRLRLENEPDNEVVGETDTAEEAVDLVDKTSPTIVLLDIRLPSMSGIEAALLMRKRYPDVRILILTGYDFDQYIRAAGRAGIHGYLLKDAPQEALVDAIREIASRLDISPQTVEAHVGNIIAKLGAQSRTEAVRIAVEKKIIAKPRAAPPPLRSFAPTPPDPLSARRAMPALEACMAPPGAMSRAIGQVSGL